MELPTVQEKSEYIFLMQPKAHQYKFTETNKTVPMDLFWFIAFLSSVRLPMKWLGSLTRSRRKSRQKRRRWLIFSLLTTVIQATTNSIVARTPTTIKVINVIAVTNNIAIFIKTIDATITLIAKTRTTRTKSPTRGKMIAYAITSRKRETRPCTTTSPLY
jgi:hypothetical protein